MSIIHGMNHFTVLTPDIDRTREFYEMLGLREGPRPKLSFPGIWLYCGDRPLLHVVTGRPMPAEPGGLLDHMAFSAAGLADAAALLKARDIPFTLRRVPPPAEGWQLFMHDPFGAKVELDFGPEEAAPLGWDG